jgi:hypothetical protein
LSGNAAALMRAHYRGSLYPTPQIIQTNKNSLSGKKTKKQPSLIAKSNKEKSNEKIDADQLSKYLLPINITHIREISPEIIVCEYFG